MFVMGVCLVVVEGVSVRGAMERRSTKAKQVRNMIRLLHPSITRVLYHTIYSLPEKGARGGIKKKYNLICYR